MSFLTVFPQAHFWILLSGGLAQIRWNAVAIPLTTALLRELSILPAYQAQTCPESAWWFNDWYFPLTKPGVWIYEGPAIVVPALEVRQHISAHCRYAGPIQWERMDRTVSWSALSKSVPPYPWTTQSVPLAWFEELPILLAAASSR